MEDVDVEVELPSCDDTKAGCSVASSIEVRSSWAGETRSVGCGTVIFVGGMFRLKLRLWSRDVVAVTVVAVEELEEEEEEAAIGIERVDDDVISISMSMLSSWG